jgi:ribosome-associated translation inhibitor RaiA
MQVQVNSDRHIVATEELSDQVRAAVEEGLGHLAQRITRVEAHLTDENSSKGGPRDKRCMLEARIKGHEPVAVNETADDLDLAVRGAVKKLQKTVGQLFDRLDEV